MSKASEFPIKSSCGIQKASDVISGQILLPRITQTIMCVTLAIYPFGLIAVTMWSQSIPPIGRASKILVGMAALFSLSLVILISRICKSLQHEKSKVKLCIALWLSGFLIRLFICVLMQSKPISDFGECYDYAAGVGYSELIGRFSYLGMYALTLKAFFQFVPASVLTAQILNCIITASISPILFLIVDCVSGKTSLGMAASGLYLIFPSTVIYTAVPSTEHFSQFYLALTLLLWCYARKESSPSKFKWILFGATGLSLGALYCYKELFIVIAPAIIMACICYEIVPLFCHTIKDRRQHWRKIGIIVLQNALIVFVALLVHGIVSRAVQITILGETYTRNSSFAITAYEGLAQEGQGSWSPEVKQYVADVIADSATETEANRTLLSELVDQYKSHIDSLFALLEKKFYINWNGEDCYYYWTFSGEGNILQGTTCGEILFAIYPKVFWGMTCLILAVGTFLEIFRHREKETKQFYYVVSGMLFLFTLALVIMEAQGRYKSSFTPAICIIFAFSLDNMEVLGNSCSEQLIKAVKKEGE